MMSDARYLETLQKDLLKRVFANQISPQRATAEAMKMMADVPLLTWIYVLTTIGSDLETSFREEAHWEPKDWFEAAASLGCDVYALNQSGIDHPTGRHHHALWSGTDPHLQSDKTDR